MVYITPGQLRASVDTSMSDAELVEVIEESDWYVNQKVAAGSLSVIGFRRLSRMLSAYMVMLRDPNASSLGEWSEDRSVTLGLLKNEVDAMFRTAGGPGFTTKIAGMG